MNKLFGGGKKTTVEAPLDVEKTQENLQNQVDNIDMRIKKIEHDVNSFK